MTRYGHEQLSAAVVERAMKLQDVVVAGDGQADHLVSDRSEVIDMKVNSLNINRPTSFRRPLSHLTLLKVAGYTPTTLGLRAGNVHCRPSLEPLLAEPGQDELRIDRLSHSR